jgi:NAD(P)H-dependent flavin oxidoreductase YrpB (nitropropane dioxygenase family)
MTHSAVAPTIIQGGMGVGVSNWRLARAVASLGQLGVVSGTGLDTVLVRRLSDGDPEGHVRRAMAAFPVPGVAEAVLERFFRPEGRSEGEPYPVLPLYKQVMDQARHRLTALATFVEVFLAGEGHDGPVGLNLLTKIQLPNLASLYGAMLAGVDYVLMGAGIPREIPGALDRLSEHEPARLTLDGVGAHQGEAEAIHFDPTSVTEGRPPEVRRPAFVPIVSSDSLARVLARKASGRVDGFVVEAPTAGGHNAPPRGGGDRNDRGEPVYGERDQADLEKVAALGLPFWLAGGAGHPDRLRHAREAGARGIQVGTLFAYCRESGLTEAHKRRITERSRNGGVEVLTDGEASPTGFPFKTVQLEGTLTDEAIYRDRARRCDLGYLRTAYRDEQGRVRYRCPAEPVETFVKKGGDRSETTGRKCLCNALMANIGRGQVLADGSREPTLYTAGDDIARLGDFLGGRDSYSAAEVVDYLLSGV